MLLSEHRVHSGAKELLNSIILKKFLKYRIEGTALATIHCLRAFF